LKYTALYNANGNENGISILDSPVYENIDTITIILRPGTTNQKSLIINTTSIATAMDKPDPGNDIFKLNYTGKLASVSGNDPIIITASNWIE